MNIKKLTAFLLSALILSLSIVQLTANDEVNVPQSGDIIAPQSFYNSFTGEVKEIKDDFVAVESKDGKQANFRITKDTYFVDNVKIEVGKELTGYYESGKMMIMIYPPQYSIDIIAAPQENMKADKFDENLISADKTLKLNLGEDTQIVWENGTTVNWFVKPTLEQIATVLGNRKMIVFYDTLTKSIPSQTTPTKIIVLSQVISNELTGEITVKGNNIDGINAFKDEFGVVMVPVRVIAEGLGLSVTWNDESQSIKVGNDVSFKIGEDSYTKADTAIKLDTASTLKDDKTFVPISFFNEILGFSAYESEGKVIVE